MRKLARQSELASGYLPMCLSGKRELSSNALSRLMPNLRMTTRAARALQLLHIVGTTEQVEARLLAIEQLTRLQGFEKKNQRDIETYRYLTKWFYAAIREMVHLKDFRDEADWIQSRLNGRVSKAECKEALAFLIEKGFVQKTADGYSASQRPLDCREGVFKVSLGEFHRQMMELGSQSIEKVPREHRYILGHTLAIRSEDFARVREILDDAVQKLEALSQQTIEQNEVYHVELASFPLTKPITKTESK